MSIAIELKNLSQVETFRTNLSEAMQEVFAETADAIIFSADIIFPKVVYREAKKDRDGQALIVNAEFQVLEDPTYGSVIVQIINEQTGYLT